jgi:signal transduction histidine kinase
VDRRGPQARTTRAGDERHRLAITVVAAIVALLAVAAALTPFPHAGPRVLLYLLLCVPIVLLRRWPVPVLAVVVVLAGMVIGSGIPSFPLVVLIALATYQVASALPRRLSIGYTVGASGVLGIALLWATIWKFRAPIDVLAVETFLPLAAAWFVGDAVAARRRYFAGLAEQTQREREADAERERQQIREQRLRIAQELHDVVAHTLAVITVQAGVGRRLMDRDPEEASKALESIENVGRTAQEELQVVLGLLREDDSSALQLSPAPRLGDLSELVEIVRASGTPVELHVSGSDRQISPALELSIYRVAQEALTNVVKHAPGSRATVDVAVTDQNVRIEIYNDDTRQDDATLESVNGTGHGIVGMRERVTAFGGTLTAERAQSGGFRVLAEVPLEVAS